MGFFDYIFNVIRSPSDLFHVLFYLVLMLIIIASAIYMNFQKEFDTHITLLIVTLVLNLHQEVISKSTLGIRNIWRPLPYDFGYFNFLFSSNRLPYFLFAYNLNKMEFKKKSLKIKERLKSFIRKKK